MARPHFAEGSVYISIVGVYFFSIFKYIFGYSFLCSLREVVHASPFHTHPLWLLMGPFGHCFYHHTVDHQIRLICFLLPWILLLSRMIWGHSPLFNNCYYFEESVSEVF